MLRPSRLKWIGTVVLSLAACSPAAWGKTLVVGAPNTPCPNAEYTTIGAAVKAADSGDEIKVCPALYPEQIVINKRMTLTGIAENGVSRVLIQPTSFAAPTLPAPVGTLPFIAVISVVNAHGVTISNLVIDGSNNNVSGCTTPFADIHYYNSSGTVDKVALSGSQLQDQSSCTALFPGNGFGMQVDTAAGVSASYSVTVQDSSIYGFGRDGILVSGSTETVQISGNTIAGTGPSTGVNQFGVFLANGAKGQVTGNQISQGTCGSIAIPDCFSLRSEGIVLRAVGDGVVVSGNTITNVQAGVFVNGATHVVVSENLISNVDALSGMQIQGSIGGLFTLNRIVHVGPLTTDTSNDEEGCGINDISGTGSADNVIAANRISDAYCGVGYVSGDQLERNSYVNTLYETLNGDDYPNTFPPPVEP